MKPVQPPTCPYCGQEAVLEEVDLRTGWDWVCRACDAYTPAYPTTKKPQGRLANAELREWHRKVIKVFARLCEETCLRNEALQANRTRQYFWLAKKLDSPGRVIPIRSMDLFTAQRAYNFCVGRLEDIEEFRAENRALMAATKRKSK